jgi:hypothetical protein
LDNWVHPTVSGFVRRFGRQTFVTLGSTGLSTISVFVREQRERREGVVLP